MNIQSQLPFATIVLTLFAVSIFSLSANAQPKGLSGGLSGGLSKGNKDETEKAWDDSPNFDPAGKEKSGANSENQATDDRSRKDSKAGTESDPSSGKKPKLGNQPKPPGTDKSSTKTKDRNRLSPARQIDELKKKIERLTSVRNSNVLIDRLDGIEDAEKLAAKYRDLTDIEWSKPRQPGDGREELLKRLDREWQEAAKAIREAKRKNLEPGSIAEKVAMQSISRELLDVYLIALKLRLLERKWELEKTREKLRLELAHDELQIEFISWENNPILDKLPTSGKGIVPRLKHIKNLMDQKNGDHSLLATLVIKPKVLLWDFDNRVYDISLSVDSVAPHIPPQMRKRAELRAEAGTLRNQLTLWNFALTPDQLQQIRVHGELKIPVASLPFIQQLQHWKLVGANDLVIHLIDQNHDKHSAAKPNDQHAENKNDTSNESSSDDKQGGETNEDSGTNHDSSKEDQDQDKSSSKDKDSEDKDSENESGSDDSGTNSKDETADDPSDDQDEEADSDSKVTFDPEDGNSKDNPPKSGTGLKDPLADLLSPKNKSDNHRHRGSNPPGQNPNQNTPGNGGLQQRPGNWLSRNGIRNLAVDQVSGLWNDTEGDAPVWFETDGSKLWVRDAFNRRTLGIDVDRQKSPQSYRGIAHTKPLRGNCTDHGYWQPAALMIANGKASGQWKGKKVDEDTCKLGKEPDSGRLDFDRMKLTRFQSFANGQFLHLVGSPAVGHQNAQFKAAATIAFDLSNTPVARVTVTMKNTMLTSSDGGKTYDFVSTRSGTHLLTAKFFAGDNTQVHEETIRIDVPGIPGIGK